jgi:hypothetical protein
MKKFAVAILMALGLTLVGCSSNNKAGNINGTWNANLTDTNGTQVFTFATAFVETGNGTLNITSLSFSTNSSCFVSGETESGTFGLSGDFNGNVTGSFGMNVQSGTPSGNTLSLTGAVSGNTITGTWSLTGGTGCTGNGTFTMTKG